VTISELQADRVVEAVYAVKAKRKLRTRGGAPYLALELVDPTGRIDARVWSDVELLDGRFAEGDAVRVLGRVELFRDRLQLDVRSLEAADVDPGSLTPAIRRDADELRGFLEFLAGELVHPGLSATVAAVLADAPLAERPATLDGHHSYAGGLLEHTVAVATICRETTQLHPRLRGDLLLAAALVHDVGRTLELGPGPAFAVTEEGRLLGHVGLGVRLVDTRAEGLTTVQKAELLHCIAVHHDPRAARIAEASVLHHANALDAVAATRPTD
jgi:3'-5' exoribonuclease